MSDPLTLVDLDVFYEDFQAVKGVSLEIKAGQIVGLIGETGSGKSSVALAAARLLPPHGRIGGRILLDGENVAAMSRDEFRAHRPQVGFVSQDAMAALNPVLPVGKQVAEMFEVHAGSSKSHALEQAISVLRMLRIPDPSAVARLYPHQLSGGMRQRVMLAIALALQPRLVIADEPTTGLDVSVQAEILSLVLELRSTLGVGILWITHDMGVVAEIADEVVVMYAGRIVEEGPAGSLFDAPSHPYTEALLRTLQDLRRGAPGERLHQISGQPPSFHSSISGCPFHPRCPRAKELCQTVEPSLEPMVGSTAACHFPVRSTPALRK